MARAADRAGMVPVGRSELVTQDMELVAATIRRLYIDHTATFRCPDPARVDGRVRLATAGELSASLLRYGGFEYATEQAPVGSLLAAATIRGLGVLTAGREEVRFARGGIFMAPPGLPSASTINDGEFAMLQVPSAVAGFLAEEQTGVPAADLRFEAMAPISAGRQRTFARTAEFVCGQLVASGATAIHSLVAQELTRLAAAAMLETFPNTTMTAFYVRAPGWVPPAAARRAAAFMEAHAALPVTLDQIAAAAGVTGRALQYAFRRCYGTTPIGYLRRARLEHAHQELRDADAAKGITVAAIARRWGWVSPSQFTEAYRKRFGVLPSHTLRT